MSSSIKPVFISSEIPHWPGLPVDHIQGVLGAVFGNYAVATPNARVMVVPIVGQERKLLLREDFRFGVDDPICHPQLYNSSVRNLACMLAPSMEPDVNHLWRPWQDSWWTETPGMGGIGRMDHEVRKSLRQQSHAYHTTCIKQICEDIKSGRYRHIKNVDDFHTQKLKDDILLLQRYWSWCAKPGTLNDVKLRFVNAQRQELNIRSRVDEQLIFGPRLTPTNGDIPGCDHTRMGALTANFGVACMLQAAGLPVWYVFDAKYVNRAKFKWFLSDDEVDRLNKCTEIPPRVYQMGEHERAPYLDWLTGGQPLISRKPVKDAVVLYEGLSHLPGRYAAMSSLLGRFTCGWKQENIAPGFVSSPPHTVEHTFSLPPSSAPAISTSSSTATASSSSATPATSSSISVAVATQSPSLGTKRSLADVGTSTEAPLQKKPRGQKGKKKQASAAQTQQPALRSRWDTVDSPLMPTPVSAWHCALQAIQKSVKVDERARPTFPGVVVAHTGYALPEAAMLVNLKNEETRARFIITFCRLLPLLEYNVECLVDPSVEPKKYFCSGKKWRLILGLGKEGVKEESLAATARSQVEDSMSDMLRRAEHTGPPVNLEKINAQPARWMNEELAPANSSDFVHPRVGVCLEIMRFLCEVNFRVQLTTLDFFLYNPMAPGTTPRNPEQRRQDVLDSITYFGASPLPEWINDGDGFASPEYEERYEAICGLVCTMEQWTRDKRCQLAAGCRVRVLSAKCAKDLRDGCLTNVAVETLEEAVAEHYIRCYIHVFSRVLTIPHHSRVPAVSA